MDASELRKFLSQAIDDAQSAPIPVERYGKPVAWLLSDKEYKRLTLDLPELAEVMAQLRQRFAGHTDQEIVIRLVRDWAFREEGGESKSGMLRAILETARRIEQKLSDDS